MRHAGRNSYYVVRGMTSSCRVFRHLRDVQHYWFTVNLPMVVRVMVRQRSREHFISIEVGDAVKGQSEAFKVAVVKATEVTLPGTSWPQFYVSKLRGKPHI